MATRQEETFLILREAVTQLFEKTFGETPKILPQAEAGVETNTQLIASLGLSGSLDASVAVGLSQAGACTLVSKMLGSEIKEFSQDAVDGAGEIVNMLAGVIKSKFAERGCVFILSLPSVITATMSLSIRQLVKSEGNVLSAEIFGIRLDVFFFYARFGVGQVTLSEVIAKGMPSQDPAEALRKLLAQKPSI